MNRSQIEDINRESTQQYFNMLNELVSSGADVKPLLSQTQGYSYVKICELSNRWIAEETPLWELLREFFVGLSGMSAPFSYLLVSDGSRLSVYVGSSTEKLEGLIGMLSGILPQTRFESSGSSGKRVYSYTSAAAFVRDCRYSGYIKGNPTGRSNYLNTYQLDAVIKGMRGLRWHVAVFAQPLPKAETLTRQQRWLAVAASCSVFSQLTYSDTDNFETTSYKKNYSHSEQLTEKVNMFCQKTAESLACGEWCTSISFFSDTEAHGHLLAGLLTAAFFGKDSEPEPVHAVFNTQLTGSPIVNGSEYKQVAFLGLTYPRYSTLLSSKELAIYCALPTMDTGGFSVTEQVSFDVNRELQGDLSIGRILDSGEITDNAYLIAANEFNRHCLVVGLTGSGKTNTVKSLLCGLAKGAERPWLVIEPAKKEYWELYKLGFSDLQLYSVGSAEPDAHPLCLNPFECPTCTDNHGVRRRVPIQTHIDFVYAAFKASFILYTPMPYVLERAIYEIYEDCGWDIHTDTNPEGDDIFPTVEDLYFKIPEVVTAMGYDSKMRNDLIGSLQARVNSMRMGSKGDTLNVRRSFPIGRLLQSNAVIELEDIGDDDVKAFIISLLLVNLLEYRRQQEDCQNEVRHLLLIEEAHRLLRNIPSGTGENADPRGAAVEFFCNLLAELRSKGQGFIIADQIPSKLAPDLIKNTNLKITHRTVDAQERELIGGAMHMTEEQLAALASLRQGVAAVYSEGDNRPKLVKPPYAGDFMQRGREAMTRAQVLQACACNCITGVSCQSLTDSVPLLCRLCGSCRRRSYTDILQKIDDRAEFDKVAQWINPKTTKTCKVTELDGYIQAFLQEHMPSPCPPSAALCLLGCLIDRWGLDNALKTTLITAFSKYKKGGTS